MMPVAESSPSRLLQKVWDFSIEEECKQWTVLNEIVKNLNSTGFNSPGQCCYTSVLYSKKKILNLIIKAVWIGLLKVLVGSGRFPDPGRNLETGPVKPRPVDTPTVYCFTSVESTNIQLLRNQTNASFPTCIGKKTKKEENKIYLATWLTSVIEISLSVQGALMRNNRIIVL